MACRFSLWNLEFDFWNLHFWNLEFAFLEFGISQRVPAGQAFRCNLF